MAENTLDRALASGSLSFFAQHRGVFGKEGGETEAPFKLMFEDYVVSSAAVGPAAAMFTRTIKAVPCLTQ